MIPAKTPEPDEVICFI